MIYRKLLTGLFIALVPLSPTNGLQAVRWFKAKKTLKANKLKHKPTKENTVFAFDLHDVLFGWDKEALSKQVKPGTVESKHGFINRVTSLVVLPFVLVGSKISKKPLGYFYDNGILKGFKHKYIEFAGCYKPKKATFELIDKLKKAGYSVVLASNVDPDSLEDLKNRFPILRNKFDRELFPNSSNKWVSKRSPKKYFHQLKELVGNKQVVFIDDKVKNCLKAQKYNIDVALQFTTAENLAKDLEG